MKQRTAENPGANLGTTHTRRLLITSREMSLPVTETSYTQLTNALWFHSRFSLQMQRNSCRKKGYKQRRRLPLTVTTRDTDHKGRGSRPLRIVIDKKANSPLMIPFVCARRSLKLLVLLRKMERCKQSANICSGKTKTADEKWFSKLPESIQEQHRKKMSQKKKKKKKKKLGSKKMKKRKHTTGGQHNTRQIQKENKKSSND